MTGGAAGRLPVLAGSGAYAVGELFAWRVGLARLPLQAKAFYGVIAAATAIGVGLNFTSIDPVKALYWSAVISGVAAVPIMIMIMLLSMSSRIMGEFVLSRWLKIFGWIATGVMTAAAVTMFVTWAT